MWVRRYAALEATDPGELFSYAKLEKPTQQIRVLTVEPGDPDDHVIECTLKHVPLQKKGHICLSYCWGSASATSRILVNGRHFQVRPNLYSFLYKARRSRFFAGPLWIDAICINQDDGIEKGAQVGLMGDIYHFAATTIVWLGPADHELNLLYSLRLATVKGYRGNDHTDKNIFEKCLKDLLSEMRRLVPLEYGRNHPIKNASKQFFTENKHSQEVEVYEDVLVRVGTDTAWIATCKKFVDKWAWLIRSFRDTYPALKSVGDNPYWNRAWIKQEIIQSSEALFMTEFGMLKVLEAMDLFTAFHEMEIFHTETLLACSELAWWDEQQYRATNPRFENLFYDSFAQFPRLTTTSVQQINSLRKNLADFRLGRDGKGLSIHQGLALTARSGCFDPRDRVFSIRSFLLPEQRMAVDYIVSHESLFCEIITICVNAGMDGRAVFDVAVQLDQALDLTPPPLDHLRDRESLLQALSLPDISHLSRWARLDTAPSYSQHATSRASCGIYLPVEIGPGTRVVLEFTYRYFEPSGEEDMKGSWTIKREKKSQVWFMRDGHFSLCMGMDYAFRWPEEMEQAIAIGNRLSFKKKLKMLYQKTAGEKDRLASFARTTPGRSGN